MDKPGKDPFFEIIDIVREMESKCDLLFQKTVSGIKDGSIPYELGMERLGKIEKEREKTKAVIQRLEDYLKNVKITEKQCHREVFQTSGTWPAQLASVRKS